MPLSDPFDNTSPSNNTVALAAAYDNTSPTGNTVSLGAAFDNTQPTANTPVINKAGSYAYPDGFGDADRYNGGKLTSYEEGGAIRWQRNISDSAEMEAGQTVLLTLSSAAPDTLGNLVINDTQGYYYRVLHFSGSGTSIEVFTFTPIPGPNTP